MKQLSMLTGYSFLTVYIINMHCIIIWDIHPSQWPTSISSSLTQEVASTVLASKMLEEGSEGWEKNGGRVTEDFGHSSSLLTSTLRQTDQGHREVFHSNLQICCSCLEERMQGCLDRFWGWLHQGPKANGQKKQNNFCHKQIFLDIDMIGVISKKSVTASSKLYQNQLSGLNRLPDKPMTSNSAEPIANNYF